MSTLAFMNIHLHIANVYVHTKDDQHLKAVLEGLNLITKKIDKMGANTDQALADLQAIQTHLTKIGSETTTLLQKITDLENAAQNTDTPQSVLDAIAAVKAQAQAVDDEVPDAPPADGGGDTQP